jgi:hypothetical protein
MFALDKPQLFISIKTTAATLVITPNSDSRNGSSLLLKHTAAAAAPIFKVRESNQLTFSPLSSHRLFFAQNKERRIDARKLLKSPPMTRLPIDILA